MRKLHSTHNGSIFRHLILPLLFLPWLLQAQIAVRGALVHTMNGAAISDGVVLVTAGKIAAVGQAASVTIPAGYRVIEAAVVTPGLIDAHSVVGLAGQYNQKHDQDQLDKSDPIQPELRALDAYNARERLVAWLREHGITTVHTGHAPGALINGQTILVKTAGNTIDEALVDSSLMATMTLGSDVGRQFSSPGTRAKGVAMLRTAFVKAQVYDRKRRGKEDKKPERDLGMEALLDILSGKTAALITAQRSVEIMTALRLAKEFNLRLVLDGAAESYLLLDEIKQAGVPVILHAPMVRNNGETKNASYETAAKLHAAGIPFAFQSGYEGYVPKTRVVLFEAAIAAANGLSQQGALAALTIDAARILGMEKRIGSLETGKDADIVCYDGDPFEYITHVCTVIIDGKVGYEGCER